ncbi:MAG: glycosyltransferase family 2 protein [Terrimicrobiaceae bacterium]
MSAPRVSIVTPSRNQGEYLAECLASVKSCLSPMEHVVIDGASTDSTRELLAATHAGPWISEPDRGQTEAINKGLAMTSGDILSYLCADDYLEPGTLDAVVAAFDQNPDADVVYGDGFFLEGDSGWKRRKNAGLFSYQRLRRGNFLIQPSVFFRRRVYETFGPLNANLHFCMDHDYWLRIGGKSHWHYLPHPLATCRLHADAKTSRQLAKAWDEARDMQRAYGITIRPTLEALWMRTLGHQYYQFKRRVFAKIGRKKVAAR